MNNDLRISRRVLPAHCARKPASGRVLASSLLALSLLAVASAVAYRWNSSIIEAATHTDQPDSPQLFPVSALGHLEPRGEIIQLAAPTVLEGARVEKMLVECGQQVQKDDLLAILDTFSRRTASVEEADAGLAVAEAKLAQVLAGAKPADVAAQEAFVTRSQATLENAKQELERAVALKNSAAISAEELDKRQWQRDVAEQGLKQAKHQLESIREIREVDIAVAKAQVRAAKAAKDKAVADLAVSEVRAPIAGQILKVYALAGEKVGDKGVLDIGDTSRMVAVAEVYEADLHRVAVGDSAEVRVAERSELLPGKVVSIGQMVGRKNVLNNDPVADTDARVVEVRIELDEPSSKLVAGLSNARVEAIIHVKDATSNRPAEPPRAVTKLAPTKRR